MIKSILKTSLFGLLLSGGVAFAQTEPCATDNFHKKLLLSNPQYAQRFAENNQKIADYIQNTSNMAYRTIDANTTYTIPVVVHVIHTGGAVGTNYNPTDAKINELLDKLNTDWANQSIVNMHVQFALAQRTPQCGSTDGIVRINGSNVTGYSSFGVNSDNTNGATEVSVKNLSRWDHDEYVNIWIVNKIDGADGYAGSGPFTAGYAYFPGAGSDVDGVIMLASQTNGGSITLSHEIGHYLNLYHTFQGDGTGSTCPSDAVCGTSGDCVSDTPPHMRSPFNCPTGTTCSGASGAEVPFNFMDYSNCQDRFTAGQKTRARAALATLRSSLMSSAGCVPPTTPVASIAAPTIANPANGFGMGPVLVSFNGNEMVSTNYSSSGNVVYVDYSCIQQYNVTAGNSYSISVNTVTNPQRVKVYIDFNGNGSFADGGDLVYSHIGTISTETHSGSIAIPSSGATPGVPLRMRVWADYAGGGGTDGPTGSMGYGQAEDYAIIVSGGSCPSVTASISSSTNVTCNGGANGAATITASGGSGFTYSWSNGAATSSISGLTANTYVCTVTNSCGNTNTASAVISQPSAVSITIGGTNSICTGSSTTLTASGATTYSWASGQTTAAITVSPSTTTTYNVTGTNASGCTGSGSRMVTVNAIPTVSGTTPGSRCGTGSVTLSATASAGTLGWYAASSGGSALGTSATYNTPSISSTTTYYVSATNGGCTSARTGVMATINASPAISASASPASISSGQSSTLTATGGMSYSWNNGPTTASQTVSPVNTTSYSVTGTGSNGCSANASVSVTVNTATGVTNTKLTAAFCGATLATPSTTFGCDAVANATNYEYEFTDAATNVVTLKAIGSYSTAFNLHSNAPTLEAYGKTYNVRVRAYVGIWGDFATVCQLSTPTNVPTTQLTAAYCGATLVTTTSTFFCVTVASATNYEFEFTDMATSVVTTKTTGSYSTAFNLHNVPALEVYGKTYSVRVRAYAGTWGAFGTPCQLSTPSTVPVSKLTNTFCGATLATATTTFGCDAVTSATNYEYEFTDVATNIVTTKTRGSYSTAFNLNMVPQLAVNGKTYNVRVRAYAGSWGAFGAVCQLSTPSAARYASTETEVSLSNTLLNKKSLELNAYPNPSNGSFTLQSNISGKYMLMNELGQVIRTYILSDENNNTQLIDGLSAGLYIIVTNQTEGIESKKIVVTN